MRVALILTLPGLCVYVITSLLTYWPGFADMFQMAPDHIASAMAIEATKWWCTLVGIGLIGMAVCDRGRA